MTHTAHLPPSGCLLAEAVKLYEPRAEDILVDEDLLDLFRIVKQVLRKKPDTERMAKLLFCVSYAFGGCVKFSKPTHEDKILFVHSDASVCGVRLPQSTSCCSAVQAIEESPTAESFQSWIGDSPKSSSNSSISSLEKSLSSPYFTDPPDLARDGVTDTCTMRSYTRFRPVYDTSFHDLGRVYLNKTNHQEPMEPTQRGFYYDEGRISREPVLLQRYAEQGVLTQTSLVRKRRRLSCDVSSPLIINTKKPKIPHRHGEFEQRRDDIIQRLRNITTVDLEQKAQRLPPDFRLTIEYAPPLPTSFTPDQASELLNSTLRILIRHSNMKPHLDSGMNQNGIYYNTDYFKLFMAFEQFQLRFAALFPDQLAKPDEQDKDKERNANMKAYRLRIEPLLVGTNWAAFRRNIVVGERMYHLTKVVGQGILLMTKELSGSKLHLTFTNSEWDEFIQGLDSGQWDHLFCGKASLVPELRSKLATAYWFHPDGLIVSPEDRKNVLLLDNESASENS
ncbi:hypothetical protein DFQ28_006063 [Apophysomyces sp. BC1034]|nr:hypothetical protein DFQ30_005736 [Apophysomyces sp. BC1015]KAG0177319.1 hypothetical protein DFQ29_004964 [Apophysomyces sp. BC1021]KAG0187619.1 hypothetical protein DFQ28_006063 [Apophysomyces sp. BC1034]